MINAKLYTVMVKHIVKHNKNIKNPAKQEVAK